MNWIRENKFWSSILAITLFLLIAVGYVYYITPLTQEKQNVDQLVQMLNDWVQKSEGVSDEKAQIPPKTYKKRLQENEERYRKGIEQLLRDYIELGKGIEGWFEGERFPQTGRFETLYLEHQEDLQEIVNQRFETVEEDDDAILGGGSGGDTERIQWPENPTENLRTTQKRFWIIKRLIYNAVDADVRSLEALSFEESPSPVRIRDGNILAERYLVSGTVILPPNKTGYFLSKLLEVKPDLSVSQPGGRNGQPPALMMHVNQFRVNKNQTTADTISEFSETGEEVQFAYPLVIEEGLDNWKLKETKLPEELSRPGPVTLRFQVEIYDPYEPTIASLLQEMAGMDSNEVKKIFKPFYTEEEVNRFLNSN